MNLLCFLLFYTLLNFYPLIIIMWLFSSEEKNMILQEYSKNPVRNYPMDTYTIKYHEWNFICGDDINVYLIIEDDKITDYSYDGNLSNVSRASAGFMSEFVIGMNIKDILVLDYDFLSDKWWVVSNKRKRASVLPILALRNAIHQYLSDEKVDDFDDLIDE